MDDILTKLPVVIITTVAAFILSIKIASSKHSVLIVSVLFGATIAVRIIFYIVDTVSGMPRKYKKDFYSAKRFKGKSLRNCEFSPNTFFEKDSDFFKNLEDKSLYGVTLPRGDYSIFDFSDVELKKTIFSLDSKLPEDSEFIQKVKYKSLEGTVLPDGDFRKYNFKDVKLMGASFTKNSRLTDEIYFFQKIKNKDLSGVVLPSYEVRNFHLYNLNGVKLGKGFNLANNLNKYQRLIVCNQRRKYIIDK